MFARIRSIVLHGLTAQPTIVRADFHATGTRAHTPDADPDTALTYERRDRLFAAVRNSGRDWPGGQISATGDLGPDASCDLALALAVLYAAGAVSTARSATTAVFGELALNGDLRPVRGAIARVVAARDSGCTHVIVPHGNAAEARHVDGITAIAATCLNDALEWLRDAAWSNVSIAAPEGSPPQLGQSRFDGERLGGGCDPAGIRAMVTAAAGGHHVLCVDHGDNPAALLARLLTELLPDLTAAQAEQVTTIHSLTDLPMPDTGLITRPPLSNPHVSVSPAAFLGGGVRSLRPGSASLAHHGVLHLNEATEFPSSLLNAVTTMLDNGRYTLVAGGRVHQLPTRFQLLLTARGCRCGARVPAECVCQRGQRMRHARRIQGALLDRVELRVPLTSGDGPRQHLSASSLDTLRSQVSDARARAALRWAGEGATTNAHAPEAALRPRVARPGLHLLNRAVREGQVSARGAEQCLRVAWTYADLDSRNYPTEGDIDEAISSRQDAFLHTDR